ncbi:MAG: TlpA family protein disulfide reductase [Pikeienuella sp.]
MRPLLALLGLAALLALSQYGLSRFAPPEGGRFAEKVVRIPQEAPAPETELTRANGPSTTLRAWRGEVAVVTLWATWCGVCAKEMPELQALAKRYQGRGLSVVTVSIDEAPAEYLVAEHLVRRGLNRLPPLVDKDQALAAGIGLRGTPTTVIIDKFGQIVAAFIGRAPWNDEATHEFLNALIDAESTEAAKALLASS